MSASTPRRGEIWVAALDPVQPGEQGGTRPAVVVSSSAFNGWPVGLVFVVPITTVDRGFAHHVIVVGGGLKRRSFAMPEYARSVSARRLTSRIGVVGGEALSEIDGWLRRILALGR